MYKIIYNKNPESVDLVKWVERNGFSRSIELIDNEMNNTVALSLGINEFPVLLVDEDIQVFGLLNIYNFLMGFDA